MKGNFSHSRASHIPIFVVFIFIGIAIYSFSLLRGNEADLRDFDLNVLHEKQIVINFQLALQDAITDLYRLTSTAANEADKSKLKMLAADDLHEINQLEADYPSVRVTLVNAGIADEKIASADTLMPAYAHASRDVIDMVDTDAATAMAWMTSTASKFTQLDKLLDGINQDFAAHKEQRIAELTYDMKRGRYIFISIILAVSVVAFFVSFILQRFMLTLETLNASTNAMLDSLGQGLLFFDAEGICSPVYSKACQTLLGGSPAHKHIAEVLGLTPENRVLFQAALRMLYAGKLPLGFSEWTTLAPKSFGHASGMTISLAYRPIRDGDNALQSILLVATDRTQEKKVETIVKENEIAALRTLRISRNRNHFIRFVRNFNACMSTEANNENAISAEQLRRDIHTLKGTADTFQLSTLAHKLHRLESAIPEHAARPQLVIEEYRPMLMKAFDSDMVLAREILGDDFLSSGEVRMIPENHLYDFAKQMESDLRSGVSPHDMCQSYLQRLIAVPVWNLLDDFSMTLQELGDRFGKPVHPCAFVGENFSILPRVYESFLASFVHIARNIIDHGIEAAPIRQERKKDLSARVVVRTQTFLRDSRDWFFIEFIDDGGGINTKLLREKLIEKLYREDIRGADDHALVQYIFDARVSTKDRVSVVSGRGIGLSAVKSEVAKLGGTITVTSRPEQGVTIRIEVPFLHDLPATSKA